MNASYKAENSPESLRNQSLRTPCTLREQVAALGWDVDDRVLIICRSFAEDGEFGSQRAVPNIDSRLGEAAVATQAKASSVEA